GGTISVRTGAFRETTDGVFALLSPSYGARAGGEMRQPLLRGLSMNAARLRIRVAGADLERSVASLRREVTETVAAVDRAYCTLAAARRAIVVGEEAVHL